MNENILQKKIRRASLKSILLYGFLAILVMMAVIGLEEEIMGIVKSFKSGGINVGTVVQVIAFVFLFMMIIGLLLYELKLIMIFLGVRKHNDIKRIDENGDLNRIEKSINEELKNNILYEDKYITITNNWLIGTDPTFFIRQLADVESVKSEYASKSMHNVQITYIDETINIIKLYGRHKATKIEKQIRKYANIVNENVAN